MNPSDRATAEGALFTDEYQLTMAQLYFRAGLHEKPARFEHFFRSYPNYGTHQAGYCINAGLEWLVDWMEAARFREQDLAYLRGQRGQGGNPLFADDFLRWLGKNGVFRGLNLSAIPEGRVVHPNVPLTVVEGPLAMAQILETSLLNHLNYQTSIATKAARIKESGRGRLVLEFGLRRAHEMGANAGARAALIGGADFTSNVGLSHVVGLPPKGTHAHSMIQAFIALGGSELQAFRAYAELYPDDCLLLVDTINTLESGVPNAIRVFEELRCKGRRPIGIRLDSGDLAYLSIQAAHALDQAGFPETSIVLSNQLDELVIWQILTQIQEEAGRYGVDPDRLINRLVYGVGTRLITSAGDGALDGVYKLTALCEAGRWLPAIKISETPEKTLNPGHKRSWRLYDRRGKATADLLGLDDEDPGQMDPVRLRHPTDHTRVRLLPREELSEYAPLLVEVLREGARVYQPPALSEMRERRRADVERLDPGVKRIIHPHIYHVSLTERLWDLKQELIAAAKG
ncbi:MAG: nicotinate phosphoribosyltransferase [Chloroflexi bacterium]|nr:nicotinate phosphoribosyltransferase [Chloroflexota bacterium]